MRDPSRDTPTEAAIQAQIANGEFDEAFNSAYKAYRGPIARYCIDALRGYVSNPEADGEDLAQEILFQFSCQLSTRYKSAITNTHTYLFMITKRRVIDEVRALKRSIRNHDAVLIPPQADNPERMYLEQERKEFVDQVIDSLPEIERVIIKLYLEERPIAEIADLIGKTEGAIRTQHVRIIDKIRWDIDLYDRPSTKLRGLYRGLDEPENKNISMGFWEILMFCGEILMVLGGVLWYELYKFRFSFDHDICYYYQRVARRVREYIKALFTHK